MDNSTEVLRKQVELTEKQLALQLHLQGVSPQGIAKFLGKSKTWVNELLKVIPKGSAR